MEIAKVFFQRTMDKIIIKFLFKLSILQRELYNILVSEDAQQVLLTPDPSKYK